MVNFICAGGLFWLIGSILLIGALVNFIMDIKDKKYLNHYFKQLYEGGHND